MNGRQVHKSTGPQVNRGDALRVSGAVLAGGHSSRMGRPKHALPMRDGRMMIEHVVGALRGVCDEVVVLGPDDVLPTLAHVHDRRTDGGPLAGIEALLLLRDINAPEAASEESATKSEIRRGGERVSAGDTPREPQHFLICPCDTPLITADLLQRLCIQTDKPITVFHIDGRDAPEPLPMRVSSDALPSVQQCLESTRSSARELLKRVDIESVAIAEAAAGQLRNINAPADFDALL